MKLKKLFEAEGEDFSEEDIFVDEEEPVEEVEETDLDTDTEINKLIKNKISFPILIEGYDEEDNAVGMPYDEEKEFASEYGEAVIKNIENNKKFILSALDIYDFEMYYDDYDSNSNVKFIAEIGKQVSNDLFMNVLKRYFKVEMESKITDDGEFTLNPVLDNKFIRIS